MGQRSDRIRWASVGSLVSDVVEQLVPLGSGPWPTADPFLFCVHHLDAYPESNGAFGPDPQLLMGRRIGQDFGGVDGTCITGPLSRGFLSARIGDSRL